jgi:hypothetical protein
VADCDIGSSPASLRRTSTQIQKEPEMKMFVFAALGVAFALGGCQLAAAVSAKKPAAAPTRPAATPSAKAAPRTAADSPPPVEAASRSAADKQAPAPAGPIEATHEQYKAYHALADRHATVLVALSRLEDDGLHGLPANITRAAEELDKIRTAVKEFSSFVEACPEYRDLKIMDLRDWEEPALACERAPRASELVDTMGRHAVVWFVDQKGKELTGFFETVGGGYPVPSPKLSRMLALEPEAARAEILESLEPLLAIVEVDRGQLAARLPDVAAARKAAIEAALKANADRRYRHRTRGRVAQAAREPFEKLRDPPKVIDVTTRDSGWSVVAHRTTGIPLRRSHRAFVVTRTRGESFCRGYELDVWQAYAGAGRWARRIDAALATDARIVSCKR